MMVSGYNWLEHTFQFIKDIAPFVTAFGICWKFIDKLFDYWSEKRMKQLDDRIDTKLAPVMNSLSEKIETLSNSIFALRNRTE